MKYIKSFENIDKSNITYVRLGDKIIEFGDHLYNFIKDIAVDCEITYKIENKFYKHFNEDRDSFIINFSKNYYWMRLDKIRENDVRFQSIPMHTSPDIAVDINDFLVETSRKYEIERRVLVTNGFTISIDSIDNFIKEINKENFDIFQSAKKYNL